MRAHLIWRSNSARASLIKDIPLSIGQYLVETIDHYHPSRAILTQPLCEHAELIARGVPKISHSPITDSAVVRIRSIYRVSSLRALERTLTDTGDLTEHLKHLFVIKRNDERDVPVSE